MSAAILLIFLTVAVRVIAEVVEIVRRPPPRPERRITQVRHVDGWIAGRYPQRFVGEHRDEPMVRSEHWGPFLRGEPTTPEQRDELVIESAFQLEFRARRMFAGAQFKGILQGQTSLVWGRSAGVEIERLLRAHEPGPAARVCLDRALAWWRAAMAQGLRIFEWDRPGYDEVTEAFQGLTKFAREEVPASPAAHGVEVQTTIKTIPAVPSPSAVWPVLRIVVLVLIGVIGTCALLGTERERRGGGAPEPIGCDETRRDVLRVAGRMQLEIAGEPERAALLDEVVAAVRAGDDAKAAALWPRVKDQSTESVLIDAHLLLLRYCERD